MTDSEAGWPDCLTGGGLRQMTASARVVTFIGAGGKTTCLRTLTGEHDFVGCPVVATTTTKVRPEEGMSGWQSLVPPPAGYQSPCFWYGEAQTESGKWIGLDREAVDKAIAEEFPGDGLAGKRFWVIEGDGANGLKLKFWAAYEPQIPRQTECGVLVIDGGLWGSVLRMEQVHRPEFCTDLIGKVWNEENAWSYFLRSPVFYSEYAKMSWVILFNAQGLTEDRGKMILSDLEHGWKENLALREDCLREKSILGENCLKEKPILGEDCLKEVPGREIRPRRLRLAAGDAKEGKLLWFDLW